MLRRTRALPTNTKQSSDILQNAPPTMTNVFGHTIPVVCDIESDDLTAKFDPSARIYLIGFKFLQHWGLFAKGDVFKMSFDDGAKFIKTLIDDEEPTLVFHNASFDVPALRCHGVDIPYGRYFCTMVAAHTWLPASSQENSLDALTGTKVNLRKGLTALGYVTDGVPKGHEYSWYGQGDDIDELFEYYLEGDLDSTETLYDRLTLDFATDSAALNCLTSINIPYIECIIELEQGVMIDTERLDAVGVKLIELRDEAKREIDKHFYAVPGETKVHPGGERKYLGETIYNHCTLIPFNPDSSDQVVYALTTLYGWVPTEMSEATGKASAKAEVLEELPYPLVEHVLRYQKMSKLASFVPGIRSHLDGNILRSSYNQCATRTTRLSASQPNVQQIPARDEYGKELRSLFVAAPGYKLVVGDQSGFQLRIMAWMMQYYFDEPRLCEVFINGEDVHQFFADIYGIIRKIAKNVTFGWCFGAGERKMAATASRGGDIVPVSVIKGALNSLIAKLPALPALKTLYVELAKKNIGIIHDWLGQRYVIPEVLDKKRAVSSSGERKVFNYAVQGSEATIFRSQQVEALALIRKYGGKMVIVVHDEVVYEVPEQHAEVVAKKLTALFSTDKFYPGVTNEMSLECQFSVCNNWLEGK